MRLAAIADDFTGATDLATALTQRGFRTVVAIEGAELAPDSLIDVDAVVVALKTRTAPTADAVAQSVAAVRRLRALDPAQYYVKYCSTFDSTPRGNIGPVLDAVLDELGERRTIVVPAFPDNGRTVYLGRLFVGDDLLEESPMRHHPLTPMTRSRVSDLLRPQTERPIAELTAPTVWAGEEQLAAALAAHAEGYVVVDATTDDDLARIGRASSTWRVVSGGAGLALGMQGPRAAGAVDFSTPGGRRLIVCGSASAQTRAQIAHALDAGLPALKLDVDLIARDPDAAIDDASRFLADTYAHDAEATPLLYSVAALGDIAAPSADAGPVADTIERVIAEVSARAVASLDVRRIIVAGGETSGAVVKRLGADRLLIGPRIAPGVCWSRASTSGGADVAVALKSGNFGADDMFTTAWEALT